VRLIIRLTVSKECRVGAEY